MKRLFFILLLAPFIAFSQSGPQKGFSITATLKGLTENELVTINDMNNTDDTLGRTKVKNGAFVLKGIVEEPNLVTINFHSSQKKLMLFLGNEQVNITGDVVNLQSVSVKGSVFHNDFSDFQRTFNPRFQKITEMNQQIGGKPNLQRNDPLLIAYQNELLNTSNTIDSFVQLKKDRPIAPFTLLVTVELEPDPAKLEKRFASLSNEMKGSFYGKILDAQMADARFGAIGSDAITFVQNDTAGNPVSLESFRGKYVLIDFWASWCKPCRMENPNVVAAFNRFKGKNFTVLGVSLDRSKENWLQAIKDDKLDWTHVSDLKFWSNEVAVKYRVQGIPINYLIDPQGKIVGKNLRGSDLHMKLCELLGCE